MPGRIDQGLLDDILGGDPLLLPSEAAALLGVDAMELYDLTVRGTVPAIQPGGPKAQHRYRTSDIDQLAGFLTAARQDR